MLKAEWSRSPLKARQQTEILREVSLALKVKKTLEVSVAFVSPAVIRRLNRDYRDKDKITDVLSFPFEDSQTFGEVLICLNRAKSQAKEFGHSLEEEVTILLIHGLVHLFGYDHMKKKEADKMFSLQKKILKKLDIDWEAPEAG
jgi:probable rRNA maturation factor